jgi:hypothetical protein
MKRHTELVLLVVVTLMVAIASTGWLLNSPEAATRAGRAIVLLVGTVCAIRYVRRLPSASPAVLCATVVGGIALVARPGWPLMPVVLGVFVALAWAAVALARGAGPYIARAWRRRNSRSGDSRESLILRA